VANGIYNKTIMILFIPNILTGNFFNYTPQAEFWAMSMPNLREIKKNWNI